MATPASVRSTLRVLKRPKVLTQSRVSEVRHTSTALERHVTSEGLDIVDLAEERGIELPDKRKEISPEEFRQVANLPEPRNLIAARLAPLRRAPQYGIPSCDLQLRTYNIRNMEIFADFAMRAAYYLGLPAKGPIPLPRITERWTVPRSNFIFKKSQENFERITMRRLIQIQDGHPEVVRIWLGVLQKYQYHGVGMKANIFEHDSLDSAQDIEKSIAQAKTTLDKLWAGYGTRADRVGEQKMKESLRHPKFADLLSRWEKEQGLERGQFQEDIKQRQIRENEATSKRHERSLGDSANLEEMINSIRGAAEPQSDADAFETPIEAKKARSPPLRIAEDFANIAGPDITHTANAEISDNVSSPTGDAHKRAAQADSAPAVADVSPEETATVEAASSLMDTGKVSTIPETIANSVEASATPTSTEKSSKSIKQAAVPEVSAEEAPTVKAASVEADSGKHSTVSKTKGETKAAAPTPEAPAFIPKKTTEPAVDVASGAEAQTVMAAAKDKAATDDLIKDQEPSKEDATTTEPSPKKQ